MKAGIAFCLGLARAARSPRAETRPILCVNADNDRFFYSHALADLAATRTERMLRRILDSEQEREGSLSKTV